MSALFLTNTSIAMGEPELLLDGTCQNDTYFTAITALGAFMSDLGVFPLANVTAMAAINKRWVAGGENDFKSSMYNVVDGHTYSVVLSMYNLRTAFAFTIVKHNPFTGRMSINYAVLLYQRMSVTAESHTSTN